MAVREYGTRSIRWRLGGAQWGPFQGGLNLRDSYNEVAPSELVDGTNYTLDERGIASKRNDCPATAYFPTPPAGVLSFFYSSVLNLGIVHVVGTGTVYKCAPGGGSWVSTGTSIGSPISFVDFGAECVFASDSGTFTFDGTTVTLRSATAKGASAASWQNKVWIAGDSANPTRVWWSNVGDAHTYTTGTDFVDLRERDGRPVSALYPSSGLLVFKDTSTYRISDSTTGANQLIDGNVGCVGPFAVAGSDDGVFIWALEGFYRGSGLGPFSNVGEKMRPRFLSANVNTTTRPLISAVAIGGRVYFAFPRTSSTIPDAILEYNPRTGSFMESYFATRVGPFAKATTVPIAWFASSTATIKDLFTGTTRTGFSASLTTGYVEPFGGRLGRLTRLTPQVFGTAGTALTIAVNYIAMSGAPATWTSSFTLASATGAQRPVLLPKIQGSAFQVTITDPNNIASFSLEAVDADFVLSSLR